MDGNDPLANYQVHHPSNPIPNPSIPYWAPVSFDWVLGELSGPDGNDWNLVGGWPTPLKNDGVRQWEGWHPYIMEQKMFETTNQN